MQANKYSTWNHLSEAENAKHKEDREALIVEIYTLEERYKAFKEKNAGKPLPDNAYEDKIDITREELAEVDKRHEMAREILSNISGSW